MNSYVLYISNMAPVTVNDRLVIIPVAEDAVITSNAADYGLSDNSGNNRRRSD